MNFFKKKNYFIIFFKNKNYFSTRKLKNKNFNFAQKVNYKKYCFKSDLQMFSKNYFESLFKKKLFKKKWLIFKYLPTFFNNDFFFKSINFKSNLILNIEEIFFLYLNINNKLNLLLIFNLLFTIFYWLYIHKKKAYFFLFIFQTFFLIKIFFNAQLIKKKFYINEYFLINTSEQKISIKNIFLTKSKLITNFFNLKLKLIKNNWKVFSFIFYDIFSYIENFFLFDHYKNSLLNNFIYNDFYMIYFLIIVNKVLTLNNSNVTKKFVSYYNLYNNSMSPYVNYSLIYNYYYKIDLPLLIIYFKSFSVSSYFNYLYFNFFFKKNLFLLNFFSKNLFLFNFEVFFLKKNLFFDENFYFFKKIKFLFFSLKYLSLDIINKFKLKHSKSIPNEKYFNLKIYYLEYLLLLDDFIKLDFDRIIEKTAIWEISEIWITTLIAHILRLWKEKKPDDKAQYSPDFTHIHELAMYLKWGWELEFLLKINTALVDRFYGTYNAPILSSPLLRKKFHLINFFYSKPKQKNLLNIENVYWDLNIYNNLFWKQILELIDINLSTSIISYRDNYKYEFQDFIHLPIRCGVSDNNWSIFILNFIYSSLFRKIKHHYYWFYTGWSKNRTPNYFRTNFSKNYYKYIFLSNPSRKNFLYYKNKKYEKFFELYNINFFFYTFIFKLFFFSKKKIKKFIKGKFFYNQLWLNIFWSYKSFMLPSKTRYDDLGIFPNILNIINFLPKNYYIQNICFQFETNIYMYSELFFPIFFFDWWLFFENYKSIYSLNVENLNLEKKNNFELNKYYFFKFKNLNLFNLWQFEFFKWYFLKIFLSYFNEIVYEYYLIFWNKLKIKNTNKLKFVEKNDLLSDVFSSCFNHWFFSSFNANYFKKSKSFEKKYVLFFLKFFKFLTGGLYYQIIFFWEVFIEFFFIKIWDFKLNIPEKLLVSYFNLYLNNFFIEILNNEKFLDDLLEKIIYKMFFWIFLKFSTESSEQQLWKFLFSDFYLREFYPNTKIFFFWYLIWLIKQLFK